MVILTDKLIFPDAENAGEDGLIAFGGDLSTERLLLAYQNGIFPWYCDGEPITWWCPNPRFVLFPQNLKVSKSMSSLIRSRKFEFSTNTAFADVIHHCKTICRSNQPGTWITDEVEDAYIKLHQKGYALSAEAWLHGELVGGLYGVKLGAVFFGESMFSKISNASKFAFIKLVEQLHSKGVSLIDCQVYTEHLESLGAEMIDRKQFIALLQQNIL